MLAAAIVLTMTSHGLLSRPVSLAYRVSSGVRAHGEQLEDGGRGGVLPARGDGDEHVGHPITYLELHVKGLSGPI